MLLNDYKHQNIFHSISHVVFWNCYSWNNSKNRLNCNDVTVWSKRDRLLHMCPFGKNFIWKNIVAEPGCDDIFFLTCVHELLFKCNCFRFWVLNCKISNCLFYCYNQGCCCSWVCSCKWDYYYNNTVSMKLGLFIVYLLYLRFRLRLECPGSLMIVAHISCYSYRFMH